MRATAPAFPRRHDPIAWWARLERDRVALVDRPRDRRYTYRDLDIGAARWAGVLRHHAIGRGTRVATLAGNRAELVELFYACSRVGAALVPLNWRLVGKELARILANARPALLLGEERHRATAEEALRLASLELACRWIDLDREAPPLVRRAEQVSDGGEHDPEDPWLVLYTSGSTGAPKGAVLTRRQIHYNAIATCTGWELGASDVAPISTPQFHTGGWNVFGTPLWERGGRIVMFDHFDPADFLDGMHDEGCTVAMTVPTQLLMLRECRSWGRALPALRWLISGGAPCPMSLAAAVRGAGYEFREGFGLTECGPNCFATSNAEARARPGSVGWPVPFLEMRLLDEQGCELPADAPGELCLRGPQMFGGYLDDPVRTREAMTDDGWLRTGDVAVRDADGAYRICGRRKEMYISGGENVYPAEVEAALQEHAAIAEGVVVGRPDVRWGEVGHAFIVVRAGQQLAATDLTEFLRARLAGYKVPKSFTFMREIPRLGSGKPDRRALAATAAEAAPTGSLVP